jgi:uncharacterized protein YqhQ
MRKVRIIGYRYFFIYSLAFRGKMKRRRTETMKDEQIIVGGQAVIEGVMMRAPHSYAVAVRRPDGKIVVKAERLPSLAEKYPLLKVPVLRGAGILIHSMILGIKALNYSANVAFHEDTGEAEIEAAKAEALKGNLTAPVAVATAPAVKEVKKTSTSAALGSMVFAIIFNVFLFIVLPLLLTNMLFVYLGGGTIHAQSESGTWYANAWAWLQAALHPVRPSISFNLVDGLIRMTFFLTMITTFSFLRDIRRVFEYHGAEHKVVYNWESGEELTVENARRQPRQHPRCGTSFLMVVMLVSIIAFSVVKFDSLFLNFLVRLALMPLVAGISYEIIRASAKSKFQWFFSFITRPGIWLQNITTKEPDDEQLEVAIYSLKEALKLEPTA